MLRILSTLVEIHLPGHGIMIYDLYGTLLMPGASYVMQECRCTYFTYLTVLPMLNFPVQ
jgi:hypothetical protein